MEVISFDMPTKTQYTPFCNMYYLTQIQHSFGTNGFNRMQTECFFFAQRCATKKRKNILTVLTFGTELHKNRKSLSGRNFPREFPGISEISEIFLKMAFGSANPCPKLYVGNLPWYGIHMLILITVL